MKRKTKSGLKGTGDINEALKTIKRIYPDICSQDESCRILKQMAEIIKDKTNNFTDSSKISNDKIELKIILQKENISPAEWKKAKGDLRRSEAESVIWLASTLESIHSAGSDKERRIRIAKARAMAKIKLLQLMNV